MSFILAPAHMLAQTHVINAPRTELSTILDATRRCLEGETTEAGAEQIAISLQKYCNRKWKDAPNMSERRKQEDPAELLGKLLTAEKELEHR